MGIPGRQVYQRGWSGYVQEVGISRDGLPEGVDVGMPKGWAFQGVKYTNGGYTRLEGWVYQEGSIPEGGIHTYSPTVYRPLDMQPGIFTPSPDT